MIGDLGKAGKIQQPRCLIGLDRRCRAKFRCPAHMLGNGRIDMCQDRRRRQCRPEREEVAGGKVTQQVCVAWRKAQEIGRARDVAVEHIQPDKEVLKFRHDRCR